MDSNGFFGVLIDLYAFLCVPMGPFKSLFVLIDSNGSLWVLTVPFLSLWILMGPYVSL